MNRVGLLLPVRTVWHCRIIPCLAADTPIILFIKSCGGGQGRWAGMHIHLCDCRQLTENVELGERAWGLASTLFEAGSLLNSPVSVLSVPGCHGSSSPVLQMDFHAVTLRRSSHGGPSHQWYEA